MRAITIEPIQVLIDGGSRDGRIVLADGSLAAILVSVTSEEAGQEERNMATGWFLEAGFGPCSGLLTVPPPIFPTIDDAQRWVRAALEADLATRSR